MPKPDWQERKAKALALPNMWTKVDDREAVISRAQVFDRCPSCGAPPRDLCLTCNGDVCEPHRPRQAIPGACPHPRLGCDDISYAVLLGADIWLASFDCPVCCDITFGVVDGTHPDTADWLGEVEEADQ